MKAKSSVMPRIAIYTYLIALSYYPVCATVNYAYQEPNFTAIVELESTSPFVPNESILPQDPNQSGANNDGSDKDIISIDKILKKIITIKIHFIILDSAEFPIDFLKNIASQSSTKIPAKITRETWSLDHATLVKFVEKSTKELQAKPIYSKLTGLGKEKQTDYLYKYVRITFSDLCSVEIHKVRHSQKALSSMFSKLNSETFQQQLTFPAFRNSPENEERAVAFVNDFFGKNTSLTLYFEKKEKTDSYTPNLKIAAYLKADDGTSSVHFLPCPQNVAEEVKKSEGPLIVKSFALIFFSNEWVSTDGLPKHKRQFFNLDYEFGKLFFSRLNLLYGERSFWLNSWFWSGTLMIGLCLMMYVAMLLKV